MRNHRDGSTGDRVPTEPNEPTGAAPTLPDTHNAFTPEYLGLLNQRDEPPTASDADAAGPWHLRTTTESRWAVLREGESLARGDVPAGVFFRPEPACLAAGLLPGTGRSKRYRLGKDSDGRGYPLTYEGDLVGHLRHFDEDLVAAMNVLDALLCAPNDFARIFDAAGGVALEHTGKISLARARGEE
jgi:hypothetical protein